MQVVHHGAQNQSSTGRPARVVSSMSPPPMSGAENCNAAGAWAGTTAEPPSTGSLVGVTAVAAEVAGVLEAWSSAPDPHAASTMPATRMGARRRITTREVSPVRPSVPVERAVVSRTFTSADAGPVIGTGTAWCPLPCPAVKTRNLLLLALGCGLAIMLAGAVFFVQLATQDDVAPPAAVGESVEVGDMSVTVGDSEESDGLLRIDITIGGAIDDDPADEFRLIASARPVSLGSSTCRASDGEAQTCMIEFDVAGVDGTSRVLFYERGEEQARWVLG